MHYPAKKNIEYKTNAVPYIYVKKEEQVFNEFTLDFNQWSLIIRRYISLIKECLLNGERIELPLRMGYLQIKKVKVDRFLDKILSAKNNKQVYIKSANTSGYYLKLHWDRSYTHCFLQFKWHWNILVNRTLIKEAYHRCDNDYTYIHKFSDL